MFAACSNDEQIGAEFLGGLANGTGGRSLQYAGCDLRYMGCMDPFGDLPQGLCCVAAGRLVQRIRGSKYSGEPSLWRNDMYNMERGFIASGPVGGFVNRIRAGL